MALKCKILEVTTNSIFILVDESSFYKIDIKKDDDLFQIHKKILVSIGEYVSPDEFLSKPYDKISDVPIKMGSVIDIQDLKQGILNSELEAKRLDQMEFTPEDNIQISINELKSSAYPSYNEFVFAIYQKEVKNNPKPYENIMKIISDAHNIFSDDLGSDLGINQIEEILNGIN